MGGGDMLQVLEMSEENGPSWIVKADLPAARWGAASAVVDGKVWLIGGEDQDRESTDSVFIYDPEVDTWTTGPPLPFTVQSGCATMHNGELHLIHRNWRDAGFVSIYRGGAWLAEHEVDENSRVCQSLLLG